MSKLTGLLACLLLLSAVAGQTCGVSSLTGIASGVVNLGTPVAQVAQTSYSISLSSYGLGTYAEVFAAFAIAGFQASSNQQFYSLIVDNIIFSNGNTQMNFTMVYNNPAGTFQTTWSSIKLSWVAVSTGFATVTGSGLGNYIWAGSVGMSTPFTNGISGPIIPNSLWSMNSAAMIASPECGYINSSPPAFDVNCVGAANPVFVTHLYIMGFQFDPSGTYSLAASVLRKTGTNVLADVNEALAAADFVTRNLGAGTTTELTGPNILINTIGSQLQYIKIGMVITTILDWAGYPANNPASFQYSGVYMNYTLYNLAQPIIKSNIAVNGQNVNYFSMLNTKYNIFGLSSFYISKLPADVTVLNYNLEVSGLDSTVLLQTDDVNYMSGVVISSDEWNAVITACAPSTTNMLNIKQKYLATVPAIQNTQQNIFETSSALDFKYFAAGSGNSAIPLSTTVLFTNILYFQNITPGMAYGIDFKIVHPANQPLSPGGVAFQYSYSLTVEGNKLLTNVVNVTATNTPSPTINPVGYIFSSAEPAIEISITLPRGIDFTIGTLIAPTYNRELTTTLTVTQYSSAYDPKTDCCVTTCPANSGVNLGTPGTVPPPPPTCIQCTAGLVYNSVTKSCQCQTGYYPVTQDRTNQTQCFPCFAQLCQTCTAAIRTVCATCVTGAAFDSNSVCNCLTGFYQNGALCTACPVKCLTCTTGSVCSACSDNTTRSFNDSCNCLTGFFDAGVAVCSTCPTLCKTCSSATNCTTCFDENNRTLINGQCVCKTGFYQVVNSDGSLTCSPCASTCTSCSLLPDRCTDCDAASNRILGYDNLGNQICNCKSGYFPNSAGQCVQSNCDADPFCSTCLTVLSRSTCIQCIAATYRVLVMPQQKCYCQTGFYDANGICTPCGSGCSNCSTASVCSSCVVSASNNNDGTCTCPSGYFFTTSPIRYCKKCPNYTLTCSSSVLALTCAANFTLTNGACLCRSGNYISALGQCLPCVSGCSTCNSSTSCQACSQPLLIQGNACVSRCGPGFYQNGFVCTACSPGCVSCAGPNICLICQSGQLAYNGFCYNNCPAGSVASNTSTCVACNEPCATCTEHPSKCTTCTSCCGNLFNFKCLTSCPTGTYAVNGTCQYCAYNCATCLGSNTTCTSCPDSKILYSGACYDKCPYLMIGGICTFNCANGLYKTAMNQCEQCDVTCATCVGNPKNCSTCATSYGYSMNGVCMTACPVNYLAIDGQCKPCAPECKGCTVTCTNCINCANGFFKLGSSCVKTCYPNMFVDYSNGICVTCNDKCKTCSSVEFCTTCANPQAVPVNGVCNDCSYPCNTCSSGPSVCTSCVSGFNLIGTTCIAACPSGAYPNNGVCVCTTGYIYSNQCVAQCPTGYGNVGGQCTKCQDNCANCAGSSSTCTACLNGYALDQVSGVCQKAPSCQFGQYFSQSSNACTRICPASTYFYENVCLTACLSGYYDNGVGGCVAATPQSGCSYPYFLSNGVCVSNCPSGTYPDTQNRVCKSCSSNCFSCLTNTFCYACNAGYDLTNGVCIAATVNCPSGQFRYNGVCYSTCPAGTCSQGNFCQRTCPAGTWSYNGGCYRTCPTSLTTADACVDKCPAGTSLVNGVCQVVSQACPSGQYWDGTSSRCLTCQYPCAECSLTASYCTTCAAGLTLSQNMCVSSSNTCGSGKFRSSTGSCQACPAKCADCISATICSTCASGFNFDGTDCVKSLSQLKSLTLSIKSVTKRGNSAYITVCPSILPNGLSPQQQNNFFTVVPATADKSNVAYVNQWLSTVDAGCVTVGVNYNSFPTQSAVFLAVNAQLLASSYLSMGYSADSSSFVSAAVNINLQATPAAVVPPSNAMASPANSRASLPAVLANRLSAVDTLQ
jgi:hypothetical protein